MFPTRNFDVISAMLVDLIHVHEGRFHSLKIDQLRMLSGSLCLTRNRTLPNVVLHVNGTAVDRHMVHRSWMSQDTSPV